MLWCCSVRLREAIYSSSQFYNGYCVHFEEPLILFCITLPCNMDRSLQLMLKWWEPMRVLTCSCGITPFPLTKWWVGATLFPCLSGTEAVAGSVLWQPGEIPGERDPLPFLSGMWPWTLIISWLMALLMTRGGGIHLSVFYSQPRHRLPFRNLGFRHWGDGN